MPLCSGTNLVWLLIGLLQRACGNRGSSLVDHNGSRSRRCIKRLQDGVYKQDARQYVSFAFYRGKACFAKNRPHAEFHICCRCWFNVGANAVARDPVGSQWLMEKVDAGLVPATSASDSESCMTTLLRVCHDMSQAGRAVHLHDLLHQVGLYNPQLVILNEQDKQLASQPHQDWTEGLESILGMLAENIPPELQQVRTISRSPF